MVEMMVCRMAWRSAALTVVQKDDLKDKKWDNVWVGSLEQSSAAALAFVRVVTSVEQLVVPLVVSMETDKAGEMD